MNRYLNHEIKDDECNCLMDITNINRKKKIKYSKKVLTFVEIFATIEYVQCFMKKIKVKRARLFIRDAIKGLYIHKVKKDKKKQKEDGLFYY